MSGSLEKPLKKSEELAEIRDAFEKKLARIPPVGSGTVYPPPGIPDVLSAKQRKEIRSEMRAGKFSRCPAAATIPAARFVLGAICGVLDSLAAESADERPTVGLIHLLWDSIANLRLYLLICEGEILAARGPVPFQSPLGYFPSACHAVLFLAEKHLSEIWTVASAEKKSASPNEETNPPFEGSTDPLPSFDVDWWYDVLPALRHYYKCRKITQWGLEGQPGTTVYDAGIEQELSALLRSAAAGSSNSDKEAAPPVSPSKADARKNKETLALAALLTIGPNATQIAKQIGVPRGTLLGWDTFREKYDAAKADAEARKIGRQRGRRAGNGDFEVSE